MSQKITLPPLPQPPTPNTKPTTPTPRGSGLAGLNARSLLASVRLLIESRSIELLVEQLHGISAETTYLFLQELVQQPRAMDTDDVIQVAYGLLMPLARDKKTDQIFTILDYIAAAPELQSRPPLLIIAAHSNYPQAITLVLQWAKNRNKLNETIDHALAFIGKTADTPMLKKLESYGLNITPKRATLVLWELVQTPPHYTTEDTDETNTTANRTALVNFLISKKADVNYHEGGYTLLMKAAEHNDATMAEELIKGGANIDTIINPALGSALQIAIGQDNIDTELVLRHYNAHE